MNPSQASSIFIFTTLFILCAHTPLTRNMQQTRHKRHRSHAQIIHDISTGAVILNSGASARIESWNGSPGRSPRAIVFIQPVPEEEHTRQEPSVATNQHPSQAPKLHRRNALSRSKINASRSLESPDHANSCPDSAAQDKPLKQNTAPRSSSFLAQLCCCASTRAAQ